MATSQEYIEFVCDAVAGNGTIRYKKMFGEYMVYVDEKPLLLVCDNTVFVKKLGCLCNLMKSAETGFPYDGAKEHYILDVENQEQCKKVIDVLKAQSAASVTKRAPSGKRGVKS